MIATDSTAKRKRVTRLSVAVILAIAVLTGCETLNVFKKKEETRWTISFHLLAHERDGENLSVVRVRSLDQEGGYLLRRIALSGSKEILRGEPVKKDGKVVAVKFKIDPYRRLKWLQLSTEYGGQRVAVCLDGYFRFLWHVPRYFDKQTCEITVYGPWDSREAELVCEWAPVNYEIKNRR